MNPLTLLNLGLACTLLGISIYSHKPDVSLLSVVLILLTAVHNLVKRRELRVMEVSELNETKMNFWYFVKILFGVAIIVVYVTIFVNLK